MTVHNRENIFDFTYLSKRENTICLINALPRQIIQAEKIILERYNIIGKQANKDVNGNSNYYFIIDI